MGQPNKRHIKQFVWRLLYRCGPWHSCGQWRHNSQDNRWRRDLGPRAKRSRAWLIERCLFHGHGDRDCSWNKRHDSQKKFFKSDTHTDGDADYNSNTNSYTDADNDAYANGNAHRYTYGDSHAYANTLRDAYAHANCYPDGHTDSNTNSYRNSNTDINPETSSNTETSPNRTTSSDTSKKLKQ